MNPREQIAAVIAEHALYEYDWGVDGDCICGFRTPKSYDFAAHSEHVAAAVVEALGLTEEREWQYVPLGDDERTFAMTRRWVSGWSVVGGEAS